MSSIVHAENIDPGLVVKKYLEAVNSKDFKTIFSLEQVCGNHVADIQKANPKILWEEKIKEYYTKAQNQFFGKYGELDFLEAGDTYCWKGLEGIEIRIIGSAGRMPADFKTKILEVKEDFIKNLENETIFGVSCGPSNWGSGFDQIKWNYPKQMKIWVVFTELEFYNISTAPKGYPGNAREIKIIKSVICKFFIPDGTSAIYWISPQPIKVTYFENVPLPSALPPPSGNRQEGRGVTGENPALKPPVSTANKLDELANISAKTEEEFKKFMKSEEARLVEEFSLGKFIFDISPRTANKANKEENWQKVIDTYQKKVWEMDPQYYPGFYMVANAYNKLNQPDKALEYALKGLQKFPYNLLYAVTAEAYSKKGDKNKALLWLEGAFKGGVKSTKEDLDNLFEKFVKDPKYLALLQKYGIMTTSQSVSTVQTEEKTATGKLYEIEVDGKRYSVIKTSNEKLYGWKGNRRFLDGKGKQVSEPAMIKKLVKTAWVYENLVQDDPYSTTYEGWEKPQDKMYLIKGIVETYKDIKNYEMAQDIIVKTWIDISTAVLSSGSASNLPVVKTVTGWTVNRFQELLLSQAELKKLIGYVAVSELEISLEKYESCQEKLEEVQNKTLDFSTACNIYDLYMSGYVREPYLRLLIDLMPKKAKELVLQGLKSAGSEVCNLIINPIIANPDAGKQILETATMAKAVKILYDELSGMPQFKDFADSKNLVKARLEASNKTMQALEINN